MPDRPRPLEAWQTITIELLVPTSGRCDQHAVIINGERVGLLSASQLAVKVREMVAKRPSISAMAESRSIIASSDHRS